jgi:hypothetical protein
MVKYLSGKRLEIDSPLSVAQFQRAVNNQASTAAESAIHHLASDLRSLPPRTPTAIPDQDSLKNRIRNTIRQHGSDLITWDDLQEIADAWDATTASFLIDAMWRQRLLVLYQADGNQLLCSRSSTDRVGPDSKTFAFHPTLIEFCQLNPTLGAFTIGYI